MLEEHNFSVIVGANFLSGGKYRFDRLRFRDFFSKDSKSLYDFIMNNQSIFIDHIKSKRKKGKLLIRKKDDYNFLKDFKLNQIIKANNLWHFDVTYDLNHLFFTDRGIITLKEWISLNEEHLI
jgi:hypothetical protein